MNKEYGEGRSFHCLHKYRAVAFSCNKAWFNFDNIIHENFEASPEIAGRIKLTHINIVRYATLQGFIGIA